MLFEHPGDPHELKNLAGDPRHVQTVVQMIKLLKQILGDNNKPDITIKNQ